MKELVSDSNIKLSVFLFQKCNISYNLVKKLLRNKDIKVNDVRTKEDVLLKEGDRICVYVKDAVYTVLYEDENIVAYYKPKGVLSQGENSLESDVNKNGTLFLMHRIDRGTDGILLFAKNQTAYQELYEAFKERYLNKYYTALVYGEPLKSNGLITSFLKKDEVAGFVKASLTDNGGDKALTEYKVVGKDGELFKLEIKLLTGKTHQIRASLPLVGMYIVGDEKYGKKEINDKYKKHKQQLTFEKLTFDFPKEFKLYYLNNLVITSKKGE